MRVYVVDKPLARPDRVRREPKDEQMPAGFIFKQCDCPDTDTGRPLYGRCPQIRQAKGQWNPDHGKWAYRIPLPPATPGKARPLIRLGLASQDDAQRDLDHVRYLLSLAGRDRDTRIEVADIIKQVTGRGRRLPDAAEVRRRMVRNTLPGCPFTVAEYLTEWFTEKAKLGTIRDSTAAAYESVIRVHLIPHLGQIQLADLQPRHVKAMFIAIMDRNREIEDRPRQHRPARPRQRPPSPHHRGGHP